LFIGLATKTDDDIPPDSKEDLDNPDYIPF
jgi:hypothetical protein